jgi:predicted acetyltransferase
VASVVRKTEIQRRRVALLTPGDPLAVQRMPKDEARKRLPDIHDRWRAQTPGALSRSDAWWEVLTHDLEVRRSGMSPLFYLVHDDGYVSYRVKTDWSDGDPRHLCWIEDYAIVTPQAHRDLWQVLLGLDLVGTIESYRIPVDDPLPYVVNDGRQVRTTHIGDGLWLRPLDVPALLSARRYAVEVDVTIGVRDVLLGDGVYRLTGAADGASCVPADGEPDVTLDVGTLGALALGGMRVLPLAEAGRISAADDVLTRLDRALLADRAPAHGTNF